MKLVYPSSKLYDLIISDFESGLDESNHLLLNSNLDIPADFKYKNYLNNLINNLENWNREFNDIRDASFIISADYDKFFSDKLLSISKIDTNSVVKSRDRLIH